MTLTLKKGKKSFFKAEKNETRGVMFEGLQKAKRRPQTASGSAHPDC